MTRNITILIFIVCVLPTKLYAQFSFDVLSVEAYIHDHKKQRSLLLARSTLEHSNKLLHQYSCEEIEGYKELNFDLDKYTRAFDVIDVMYQSLRTAFNVKDTYKSVSERLVDYKKLLTDFNDKVVKRKHIELADTLILSINARAIRNITHDGEHLLKSMNDLVLYATGAAACSTADLLFVLDEINNSLDGIERHLNRSYYETWRYIQLRMGYWKEKVYRTRTKKQIIDNAFERWRNAGLQTK